MQTYIDSSYPTHMDMRGHTDSAITFGTGDLTGKGNKQKMNSKSSDETEVIEDREFLPYTLWYEYYMKA